MIHIHIHIHVYHIYAYLKFYTYDLISAINVIKTPMYEERCEVERVISQQFIFRSYHQIKLLMFIYVHFLENRYVRRLIA